jgi:hypothetical protein
MDEPLRSMDANLHRIARTILAAGLDFDFIDTRDLISSSSSDGKLHVGPESYSTLIIPPGAVMCPRDLEMMGAFVRSGGCVLAFEPCSGYALPEISSPPTGSDLGPGRSTKEVVDMLAAEAPSRVHRVSLGSDWLDSARCASDTKVSLNGAHLVARRSIHGDSDVIIIANGSKEAADATVTFSQTRRAEIWDPWDGVIREVDASRVEVPVPGCSAVVVVSPDRKA